MLPVLRFACFVLAVSWVLPAAASKSGQLAVVVNSADPQSRLIADYYQKKRGIPDENIIVVEFPVKGNSLGKKKFQQVRQLVEEKTPAHVQFYALAWSKPFKVNCMSITSAFAFGFDEKFCVKGCKPTADSPYFNSVSRAPRDEYNIRPTMMLAGSSVEQVRAMIDRGVRSDYARPDGVAYLVSTSDKARNVRAKSYSSTIEILGGRTRLQIVDADALEDKNDVMFYFTGKKKVTDITTNKFIDGAIADHLTSTGGVLFGGRQMSLLRWLDAGATASYGTVVEPCAFPQKFPHPGVVIDYYTRGETLIEAYWKSVKWPGQGLFVGEPLATPFSKVPVNHVKL
jgi:uncharacterized protein (TIGR03790 family)